MKKTFLTLVLLAGFVLSATTVFADTSSVSNTTTINCIGSAVNAREQSISSAMGTYTSAINSAYSSRSSALQSAYSQTDNASVKTAVKNAWTAFNKTKKTAMKDWSTARSKAWSTFRTASKTCKSSYSISDSAYSSSEIQ